MKKEKEITNFSLFKRIIYSTFWLVLLVAFVILNFKNPIGFIARLTTKSESELITFTTTNLILALIILFLFLMFLASFIYAIIVHKSENTERINNAYSFLDIFTIIPVVLSIFLILDTTFISPVSVSGRSMMNTINDGDYLLTFHTPSNKLKKDDIIILEINTEADKTLIIKRVIALEGDVITFKNEGGRAVLTVNGTKIDTGSAMLHSYKWIEDEYTLAGGEIFVMGDHYSNSLDSRTRGIFTITGANKNAKNCGTVVFSLKPFGKIKAQDILID